MKSTGVPPVMLGIVAAACHGCGAARRSHRGARVLPGKGKVARHPAVVVEGAASRGMTRRGRVAWHALGHDKAEAKFPVQWTPAVVGVVKLAGTS